MEDKFLLTDVATMVLPRNPDVLPDPRRSGLAMEDDTLITQPVCENAGSKYKNINVLSE